jgi:hypothetical protein
MPVLATVDRDISSAQKTRALRETITVQGSAPGVQGSALFSK